MPPTNIHSITAINFFIFLDVFKLTDKFSFYLSVIILSLATGIASHKNRFVNQTQFIVGLQYSFKIIFILPGNRVTIIDFRKVVQTGLKNKDKVGQKFI